MPVINDGATTTSCSTMEIDGTLGCKVTMLLLNRLCSCVIITEETTTEPVTIISAVKSCSWAIVAVEITT
jgi:hypothetical protein